jgi:uncharacterized protein with von Willebrand factor type A (vWA) domain
VRARFTRWDATQDPLGPDLDLGRVLDELSDELLSGWGGERALTELHRRGLPGHFSGLDSLLDRLRHRRRELARSLNLSGPLEEAARELSEIVSLERAELGLRDDEDARTRESLLDALPDHPAGALTELMSYDFTSRAADRRFQELLASLRKDVVESYFRSLAGALGNLGPDDVARLTDMLAELNAMVGARDRGEDHDFEGFMSRYADMFPDGPATLDELLGGLATRMAAMSRLLASMSRDQRRELAELTQAVMGDLDLDFEMARLAQTLRATMPHLGWQESAPAWGDQQMPLAAAVDAVERVSELDELELALGGDYPGAALEDIDEDKLRRSLGDDAVVDVRRLKRIESELERAGVLERSRGRLELTARGARLLGERSLTRVLERIRREPSHRARGGHAEPTGQTRPWVFGDEEEISVGRTIMNAVARSRPAGPIRLRPEDFEVIETETRPRTATALLLDLSFSMPLGGHWVPAKKMALALDALIEGKFPHDELYLIGFSDYARRMRPAELAGAGWEHVHGTNMQHAFLLANRVLGEGRAAVKQVIMVTDGEPTAHLDADGHAFFNWPPVRETLEKTLREAARLARSGIAINVFMLERSPGLVAFMDRLAKLTGGEVMSVGSDELEDSIVGGYAGRRERSY